ncbi:MULTISPECIES: glycosyltransferase family 4 protein [unclassified Bradyrhizobium]
MRINFILPVASMGGGTKVVAVHARELMKKGHQVVVISPAAPSISVSRKLTRWLKGEGWASGKRKSHLEDAGVEWRVLDGYREVRNKDVPDADVVVATWWETAEWVYALAPEKGAKVYFVQGHEIFPHVPLDRCRATYRYPFHKIVVSNWLKAIMREEYGDAEVDLVPNSVDREQFFSAPRTKQIRPTVGFLYSLAEVKRVDLALAAIGKVRRRRPELRSLSFGQNRPIRRLPLGPDTKFSFLPSQSRIREIYSSCDVWLSSSQSEGFNLTAMEAMACRTPVVSARTGWPDEAIKAGWNGWLADIDDVESLAHGLDCVLALPEKEWMRLSENAFLTVADTSWKTSSEKFERALMRACERAADGEIAGGDARR